ncbi:EAL domain-containing protein [Actinomarinicola tropica]|uniref:EAL domain-containing protein n=1 Tax=Actinomarinicola tropica TaxID=2789776 RepID=A0A5Q2RD67_9ACTN|nr:EAL domain-containing protein [Actinomarinicola tropica]QGG93654.1 EAL domain-containing protein [Actinomarinicola tropica]
MTALEGRRPDDAGSLPLDAAIAGDGVRTVVQPIVDLVRGQVTGYEALTRFDLVPGIGPDRWFDAAAESGLSAELEATTLARALERRHDLPANCFLTVNVEPSSLAHPRVAAVLQQAGDLRGVVLELTEHRPIHGVQLAPVLRRYRGAGARIAVDDAGAGYAGLQQILELRPDFLKLDRSLVTAVDRDLAKAGLVEMLGLFADRIDAWVIAEGLETDAEVERVADLGVPLGQGWALGRPDDDWAATSSPSRRPRPTDSPLHPLLHRPVTAPAVDPDAARRLLAGSDAPYVVLLDESEHPTGVVDTGAALDGTVRAALRVNLRDSPVAVARRLAVRGTREDVLVIDDAGRFVGAVSVERLLVALADGVEPRAS